MNLQILNERKQLLEAELGAIKAFEYVTSREASATIRQCSKLLDGNSVQLRRELIEFDKSLTINTKEQ